ncbi:elongation factor G [Marichromatium bheemlicum]|uniref:Elongation factor G n=1 Tax=Marichromatium bheemlicum TaxID=365339 RepID=A0ABX1I8D4_9GAMM|nr:elongation factor G [Marichromatium bheemlicum]NKN33528.1 elongation factor G [Marichromatium bheemlicum]
MSDHNADDVRNIALLGHAGAGKTSLTEALLAAAGAIPTMGSTDKGTTVCDQDPREQALGHSLDAAIVGFTVTSRQVNLIDTPGLPDLLGRSLAVLPAVETAALVINAQAGIEPMTARLMKRLDGRGLCRMIIVNQIDAPDLDLATLTDQIRDSFGPACLPINLPAEGGKRVIDCFFAPREDATDFSSVHEAHEQIVDQVVELDEALMETYLEQGQTLAPEQLHDPFEAALRDTHLIPICFVSAHTGAGIPELLEVIAELMPNPAEGNPPAFLKGAGERAEPVTVSPDPGRHAIAHVFKVLNDPYRGRLGIFRIHQGRITPTSALFVGDARKPFKATHLYRLQGKELIEVADGIPGDILAVSRVDEVHLDAVLHDSHDEDHFQLARTDYPTPLYGLAITPRRHGDEQKLTEALHKLEDEDPCFKVDHHAATNETVIRGLGEFHLKLLLERLADQFHVEVDTQPPRIPYRETITAPAEGHYRHKKQTGGAGQFGEVFLRVEPLARGAGFRFVDAVVGGAIPGNFIPSIEKGVRQVLDEGVVAGYPLQDVQVTVYDGKSHAVDSKEVAFITAARKAFIAAIEQARPAILEPIVHIRISAQEQAMGDLTGDLAGRRGRITGTETKSWGRVVIEGEVPLAELEGYESRLKSLTGGEGVYSIDFSHYEPVGATIQKQLIEAHHQQAPA